MPIPHETISVREYTDQRIEAIERFYQAKYDWLKAYVDLQNTSGSEAIRIAREELARRLDILNHAHEQAKEIQQTYVRGEIHGQDLKELNARIDSTVREIQIKIDAAITAVNVRADINLNRINELEGWRENLQGRMTASQVIFSIVFTVLNIAIGIVLHFIK